MIPNIFRYAIPHQANPYQKGNSNSIHYGFRGQNHNPVLRFNPIPIQSIPMKSRFKHLENGVYGKSTKRRLQDVSIPDFLTTIHFNHELFNHELSTKNSSPMKFPNPLGLKSLGLWLEMSFMGEEFMGKEFMDEDSMV